MSALDAQITFCGCADLERTAAFYEDALGLELVLDQGRCRVYRTAGSAYLGFCQHLEVESPGVILTLVADDVEDRHRRLVERGVPVEAEPKHNDEFGITHFYLRDPDGHRIEIQRFDDPEWSKS
jgi:catechol 2,3-dioxygenase-like lactoylglutathione lyase family enzyme